MSPPRPVVASPVSIVNSPLVPVLAVPVVNNTAPLTPLKPASAVVNSMLPLDVSAPTPLWINI